MGSAGFVLAVFMQLSLAFLQRCLGLRAEETLLSTTTTTEAARFEALKTLTIVHAGAYHSHLYEVDNSDNICSRTKKEFRLCYGGMARHQTILKRAKLLPAAVSLFTGDMFRGSVWFRLLGWDVPTIALQMLQFDALTLGEHEFYRGPLGVERVLKTLSEKQSAALVLCNGDFSRESTLAAFPLLKSLVLTRGNVRVGLIGYVRDDLNATSQPGPTLGISSDLECVRQQADAMRAHGVDVVIAFGGGNLTADRRIAQEVINVSVLVTKYEDQFAYPTATEPEFHKPVAFDYPMKVARKDGSQGYIVASNKFVQFIGMVNVTVDSITRKVVNVHGSPILLDKSIPLDPEMQAAVEGWHSRADPLAAEVVGSSKVFIENDEACSVGQCNGGTMMADAIFDYFSDMEVPGAWSKINAAVVNAAVSRTSFDERVSLGELTLADMYEMYPYEDEYFLVTMRGEKLYAMMEHSVHFEEHTAEKFLQVSGIRVVYNRQAPPGRRVRGLLILCASCQAPKYERVVRLQWYTIAMPEFMVNGGNGYDFRDVPRGHKKKTGVTDAIVMKRYIRKKTPLFPAVDDRIIFMDAATWPCPDALLATALAILALRVFRREALPS